jgi:abequosyltransferase
MGKMPFISICILSYNRPETLNRLLNSIDTKFKNNIEVVVCEDCSPRHEEIYSVVESYSVKVSNPVRFYQNEQNLGYDGTFNRLMQLAAGEWLIFMGDDDEFVPQAFDKMFVFLKDNPNLGYVMKSHYLIHSKEDVEQFRYFKSTKFFSEGEDAYLKLFRRSVFIAGFTIRRKFAAPFITNRFNGTMLMQLYLLAEVVLRYPSAYYDEPFTQQYASHAHNLNDVMFDRENKKYIPRKPTLEISLNFLRSFGDITAYIDKVHSLNLSKKIKFDMSKYFYHSLSVHRDSGLLFFLRYVRELNKLGFNASKYYYIYVLLLIFLGRKICDRGIFLIKRMLGYTPQL